MAMGACRNLFNHGQKHDGPNLRVMESMLMMRPLITDVDARSGMELLFTAGTDYIPYEAYSYEGLEEAMKWAIYNPRDAAHIAANAYTEVNTKHLVQNRIDQILEVAGC
jgi:spore maturation protein CgeB